MCPNQAWPVESRPPGGGGRLEGGSVDICQKIFRLAWPSYSVQGQSDGQTGNVIHRIVSIDLSIYIY